MKPKIFEQEQITLATQHELGAASLSEIEMLARDERVVNTETKASGAFLK